MNGVVASPAVPRIFSGLMNSTVANRNLWLLAFSQGTVWVRAAKVGLPVGCLQAVINQGDVWWQGEATGLTLAKTIISPFVTFGVALAAAAGTWVEKQRSAQASPRPDRTNLASNGDSLNELTNGALTK